MQHEHFCEEVKRLCTYAVVVRLHHEHKHAHGQEWHLIDQSVRALKCQPTTYSAPMLRELLANRTLAFLGDSNARLVHALAGLIA